MPVIYGGYNLRPCETADFSQEIRTTEDGRNLGAVTRISLKGSITPECINGTLVPLPIDEHLSKILSLQKEIRLAFATPGKLFEVQGWDGTVTSRLPTRTISVDFVPGNWLEVCEYQITLEGVEFSEDAAPDQFVESASENWSFEQAENPKITRATHTIQAKGVTLYDGNGNIATPAWQRARDFAQDKLKLGWTAVGDGYFSPLSGQQIASTSAEAPLSTTAWNRIVTESIEELAGTYQVTETFLLNDANYYEEATVSVQKSSENAGFITTVSLTGTVHGLFPGQNQWDARLANAIAGFATIQSSLQSRANAAAGVTLNPHPVQFNVDQNPVDGTLSYSYGYNDRVLLNDTYEIWGVDRKASLEDYRTSVTVSGTIYGVVYPEIDTDPLVKIQRAQAQFARIQGLLYQRAVSSSGVSNLQLCPLEVSERSDQQEGTVNYSWAFDNRLLASVSEQFTVSRKSSLDDPRVSIVVEGTIQGLRTSTCASPFSSPATPTEALNNALAYFDSIQSGLLSRAALYVNTTGLNPTPWSTSISQDLLGGRVSYAFEFTTSRSCYPFALSSSVQVSEDAPTPVVAVIPVLGRAQGPVIQKMGTVKERRRSVAIELVIPIPASPCGYQAPPDVDIEDYAPQGSVVVLDSDVTQWSYTNGRYSRNATWLYES